MPSDIIKLHAASTDSGVVKPYDFITVSTMTGFASHTQCDMKVLGAFKSPVLEGDEILYIDGEKSGLPYMRDTFSVKLQPFTYKESTNDLRKWETNSSGNIHAT